MDFANEMKDKILRGCLPNKEEALRLADGDLEQLAAAAREVRGRFCGNRFHLCAIISAKTGTCSENCRFCAQSRLHRGSIDETGMLDPETMAERAVSHAESGVERFSFVTSGRKLSDAEVETLCEAGRKIRERCGIGLCSCNGLLSREQLERLHAAGVTRYHCNLETSRRFFPEICTSHTYEEKIRTLTDAREAGMEICSGGIIGMGETREDRVDLALTLRGLGVASVPINVLDPIPGTPLEHAERLSYEEICRTAAVFRLLLPSVELRFAGGRLRTPDQGLRAIRSGLNAVITGNLLTTGGVQTPKDIEMAESLGFGLS